ncbi:lytic transglycosylase domain-containing protein [Amycolatopsis sacchari]|uniref:Membrane-bound lytic murein transglycosylase B n=1 Tax=Amycolatopsis sacchari TaxID=115433 RepID=A0A1I3X547_9PSEU|nr:lytic murein transglycosylase [Amycolatopsis sacchari]SFK14723.1 Membrane-bound lytic murein transglycosylase B [Amycolatopsis sacchari]
MRLTRLRIARRKARRIGLRYRTLVAVLGGTLAVLPAGLASARSAQWSAVPSAEHSRDAALVQGLDPALVRIGVDGSLPRRTSVVEPLPPEELPSGPLGIPGTALKAYRNAADLMARDQPGCHIDWALIASIGRIESNHARGGYVDANGHTREPILGPVLNGVGDVAAIPDTDGGRWDGDTVWDRAVGPTQFIPSTWLVYGVDGNGDGVADPNNIYDATLTTGRYLCSGGLDLANPDQLRAAIYRYNNSDVYVDTVIRWAEAYRKGVLQLPDSGIPVGAPAAPAVPAPPPVTTTPAPPPVTTPPAAVDPRLDTPTSGSTPPSTPDTTTTTLPTCEPPSSEPSSTTPPTSTTPTPPPTTCVPPPSPSSSGSSTTDSSTTVTS